MARTTRLPIDGPDELDWKILEVFTENSRISLWQASRSLQIPQSTINYRLKKLREMGILKKFTIGVDPFKAGLVVAVFSIDAHPGLIEKVALDILKLPKVVRLQRTAGDYGLVGCIQVGTLEEFASVTDDIAKIDGVKDMDARIVVTRYRDIPFPMH